MGQPSVLRSLNHKSKKDGLSALVQILKGQAFIFECGLPKS